MASIEAANLFAVKDLVAVVTGGGSGQSSSTVQDTALANGARLRHWTNDGKDPGQ